MTKKHFLLAAIVASSLLIPAAVRADRIQIQVGDRPFYSHGERYWDRGYEMYWVPGHISRFGHHWVHGQYVRREHRHFDGRHEHYDDGRNGDHR